jgi:hypothetical protein
MHCYAAFNFGWVLFHGAGASYTPARLEAAAREFYGMTKLRAAGTGTEEVISQVTQFTLRHGKDTDSMMSLLKACQAAQDRDPGFRASHAYLLSVAPKIDADCRNGGSCEIAE